MPRTTLIVAALAASLLGACVPLDPLDLQVPDARPPDCVAASDCVLPGAEAACVDGVCAIGRCVSGNADADGIPANGCESCAPLPGPDSCDGVDSDCDGRLDEDGDGTVDACGGCDIACVGAEADYVCRDDACVVLRCAEGRYAVGGAADGCPCAVDALTTRELSFEPAARPVAPRLAFPGDGQPGAVVWVETEAGRHRLMSWGLTPAGHPVGDPAQIAALAGPHDVVDAWFTARGALVALLSEPDGADVRLTAWRDGAPRVLGDDCRDDRCRVVRLPEVGAGLVRRVTRNDSVSIEGPDGETIERWNRPMDGALPDVDLIDAACLAEDFCVVAIRRDGLRLIGEIEGDFGAFDGVELETVGDRIWLAGRIDDSVLVAHISQSMGSDPVGVPVDDWQTPRILPDADGGVWLVSTVDGEPVGLPVDADLNPLGDPRPLRFLPSGVAAPGVLFDQSPRAGTAERLLWVGLADGAPVPDAAPTHAAGQVMYRGPNGVFAVPDDARGSARPELLLRRLDVPSHAPAAARIDGRSWVAEPVAEGVAVIDAADPERQRLIELWLDAAPVRLRAGAAVALAGDGRLAVAGTLPDGRAVFGSGQMQDDRLTLTPTGLPPEADVALAGHLDGPAWAVSRLEPGFGFETVVRRLAAPDAEPLVLARRLSAPSAALATADHLLLAWLDRRTDRCGDGPDQVRLTALPALSAETPTGRTLPRVIESADCPRDLSLTTDGQGIYLLVDAAEGVTLTTLDTRGAPIAPGVTAPVAASGRLASGVGPTAMWMTADGLARLPFDCRDGAEAAAGAEGR